MEQLYERVMTEGGLRPRERALLNGIECLSDFELVQALIGSGGAGNSASRLASEVIKLLDINPESPALEDFLEIKGLGIAKSTALCAAFELARRTYYPGRTRVRNAEDLWDLIRHHADREQERFISCSLNGAHEVVAVRVLTIGLLNRSLVHPREVYAPAIADRAAAIIVAHNHPSGELEPSLEDHDVTRRLRRSGEVLGVELLDHVIFSRDGWFSFAEKGLLTV